MKYRQTLGAPGLRFFAVEQINTQLAKLQATPKDRKKQNRDHHDKIMARLDGLAGLMQLAWYSVNKVQNAVDHNKAILRKALHNARIMMYNQCFGLISSK